MDTISFEGFLALLDAYESSAYHRMVESRQYYDDVQALTKVIRALVSKPQNVIAVIPSWREGKENHVDKAAGF